MLMIRLMRFGRKHQPFFRLVVVPKRSKPTRAKYVDTIGWVDPVQHKRSVNVERAKHWISVGAKPSDTVWNLFVTEGVVRGKKRPKGILKKDEGRPNGAVNKTTEQSQGLPNKDKTETSQPLGAVEETASEVSAKGEEKDEGLTEVEEAIDKG